MAPKARDIDQVRLQELLAAKTPRVDSETPQPPRGNAALPYPAPVT